VLLTFGGDILKSHALLKWIAKLGKVPADLLLVADQNTPFDEVVKVSEAAGQAFNNLHIATTPESVIGWPAGCYSLFRTACEAVQKRFNQPFLLMEPDAIPLCPGWFETIRDEYEHGQWPFVGHIYEGIENFIGERFMSGIGVYPADTATRLKFSDTPVHWDVHHRHEIVPNASHTDLIVHFFGQLDGGVHFIADSCEPQSSREKYLSWIPEGCCLFHRDKKLSLIPLLSKKLFPHERLRELIKVVLPVHAGDIAQAIHHAQWLRQLSGGQKWRHEAIVAFDKSCPVVPLNAFETVLRTCFENVSSITYEKPSFQGWPHAANWMFQSIAWKMLDQKHSWLLLEADACVLRRDWLDQLQEGYELCGKNFFGPHVRGMGHANGVMIYPPETPKLIPSAMTCVQQAWDYACSPEMMPDCADASHLLQHGWSVIGEDLSEVGGGQIPTNFTPDRCRRWLKTSAVIYHRVKDNSLIEALRSGSYQHAS